MCFSSYKNRKLKVKLWWVGACERKKRAFFVPFVSSEGNFLTFVLFQCVVHSIHYTRIYILLHIKNITSYVFCLFLKSSKGFSVSLSLHSILSHDIFPFLCIQWKLHHEKSRFFINLLWGTCILFGWGIVAIYSPHVTILKNTTKLPVYLKNQYTNIVLTYFWNLKFFFKTFQQMFLGTEVALQRCS